MCWILSDSWFIWAVLLSLFIILIMFMHKIPNNTHWLFDIFKYSTIHRIDTNFVLSELLLKFEKKNMHIFRIASAASGTMKLSAKQNVILYSAICTMYLCFWWFHRLTVCPCSCANRLHYKSKMNFKIIIIDRSIYRSCIGTKQRLKISKNSRFNSVTRNRSIIEKKIKLKFKNSSTYTVYFV